jgi:GNAT superfamily N-acetyltransferase
MRPDGLTADPTQGAICMLAVHPEFRKQGIGTQLLEAGRAYLRRGGATKIVFGPRGPFSPFYWGMYGGCDLPGVLRSDTLIHPFLLKRGFVPGDTTLVLNTCLDLPSTISDPKFFNIRRQFRMEMGPRPITRRTYQEWIQTPLESMEFDLYENSTGRVVAHASVWDMDLYGWRWRQPSMGLVDFWVRDELQNEKLDKFLLSEILHYLQDQFYSLVETQLQSDNSALFKSLAEVGFHQVDEGLVYLDSTVPLASGS